MDGIFFPLEMMHLFLAHFADTSPSPCQAGRSEQRRLDGHGVISRHVLRWLGALDIKLVGLGDHVGIVADQGIGVQRQF